MNECLGLIQLFLEAVLQLCREVVNDAPLFVVIVGIVPEKAGLFLKCSPALKLAHTCRTGTTVDTLNELLQALEGKRLSNDSEVVLEAPWRKVDKVEEIRVTVLLC